MENGTPRALPRAFYPDYMESSSPEAKTPGWDTGPELRFDGTPSLRRVLGWSSIGLGALALALPRGRAHAERLAGALLLVGGVAAIELLERRRRSWTHESATPDDET